MSGNAYRLPDGFSALEPFVDRWAGETTMARVAAREGSSMEDIRAFYDTMLAHADAAVALIDRYPVQDLPPDVGTLCRLMLGLAHAAAAIEILGTPRVPTAPFPTGVAVTRGAPPYG